MNKSIIRLFLLALIFSLIVPCVDFAGNTNRTALSGNVKNFFIPDYYKLQSGKRGKLKSLLTGLEATPQKDGTILIKNVKIENYDENGTTNAAVVTGTCKYIPSKKQITSDDVLTYAKQDDSIKIQGMGFIWEQEKSLLTISNKVVAQFKVLDVSGFAQKTDGLKAPTEPVKITANILTFDQKGNFAQFSEDVHVIEEQSHLTCQKLSLDSLQKDGEFAQIKGDGNFQLNVNKPGEEFIVLGNQFVYDKPKNELTVEGDVTWSTQAQMGRSDVAIITQNGKELTATGNVYLEINKPKSDNQKYVGIPLAKKDDGTGSDILIATAQKLHALENKITMADQVTVTDTTTKLDCDQMEILYVENPKREITQISADGNVVITQADYKLQSDHADFLKMQEQAVFIGNVQWGSEQLEGKSEQLGMWNDPKHALALGNVEIRLNVSGRIKPLEIFGPELNTPKEKLKKEKKEQQKLLINSPQMLLTEEDIIFQKDVQLAMLPQTDTENTKMSTQKLTLSLSKNQENHYQLQSILAERNVNIEQNILKDGEKKIQQMSTDRLEIALDSENGTVDTALAVGNVLLQQDDLKATGSQAQFQTATQQLILSGNPVAYRQDTELHADLLIWDRKKNNFSGKGKYKIEMPKKDLKNK